MMKGKETERYHIAGFEDRGRGPRAQPLDLGKGRRRDSALRIPEINTAFPTP